MDTITASCPKCATQYQLTQEQLNVAQGQVRCGACMTVFQAVPAAAPSAPPTPPPAAEPKGPSKSSFVNDEDDLLLNDTGVRQSFDKSESFATGEFSSDFSDLDAEEGFGFGDTPDDDAADDFDQTDESWAEALLEDDDEDDDEAEAVETATNANEPRAALGSSSNDLDAFDDIDGLDDSLVLQKSDEDELGLGLDDKEGLLGRINPEPLEFSVSKDYSLWKNLAYGLLSILLIGTLVSQFLVFQFSSLSRDPDWRPIYQQLCQSLSCVLPEQYKLEDISARHLNVKTHPNYKSSLLIDAVLTNHADIQQPFPKLQLFFTDNNQQVVAARQFKPDEYLRGELSNRTMMPSRQPIHLALAIKDPGKRATGYSIKLSY